ncbi:MAG: flagellar biosynthesis protein FlhF [Methylococcales bacterium]|nr:flagellar biosynthesis protein FlhF [Methylococcales bacterium]
MKIKRFVAKDIRQAMRMVKEELGADAVIMSNKSVDEGVEIVAARDFDEEVVAQELRTQKATQKVAQDIKGNVPLTDFDRDKESLHIVSSARKKEAFQDIPNRYLRRKADQYTEYSSNPADVFGHEKLELKPSPALPKIDEAPVQQPRLNGELKEELSLSVAEKFMQEMRDEIKTFKGILGTHAGDTISAEQEEADSPKSVGLLERLDSIGLSDQLAQEVVSDIDNGIHPEDAFLLAKEKLTKMLPIVEDDLLDCGGIVALVGPTGVGKTTTIAKLAAKYMLKHGAGSLAFITTDNYRVGVYEQLSTYGRLLEAPVKVAKNAKELQEYIEDFRDKKLILIDTAGMSPRDMRLINQIQTLQQNETAIRTYLVMSAATQPKAMHEIINVFSVFKPAACILTKLDETALLGSTLSVVIEHTLPISFLTNGQQVPEDIHFPNAEQLIDQCVMDAEKESHKSDLNDERWVTNEYV